MNYSGLYFKDTNNGDGFRVTLFVSGCGKIPRCKGCHNEKAWDFKSGEKYDLNIEESILTELKNPLVSGLSILGGEPMDNLLGGELIRLAKKFKLENPKKSLWVWTGYEFEDLIKNPLKKEFLKSVDVLIDGEFIIEEKNLTNKYRNSNNQRVLDIRKSLNKGRAISYKFK